MSIASQFFPEVGVSTPAPKRSVSFGEFLLSLFVVVAAMLLGAVGGIWLAERDRSAKQQEIVAPRASEQVNVQPLKTDLGRSGSARSAQVPKPEAKGSKRVVFPLGLPSVRAVQHSYRPDYTEIGIELRSAVLLHAAHLHAPERVYFDLADSKQAQRPKGRLKSRREVPVNDARVAGVRAVRWESGAVRVVVDLKRPCEYSYRLSSGPPSLLILELRTHVPSALARHMPPRQGASGAAAELAANRH